MPCAKYASQNAVPCSMERSLSGSGAHVRPFSDRTFRCQFISHFPFQNTSSALLYKMRWRCSMASAVSSATVFTMPA